MSTTGEKHGSLFNAGSKYAKFRPTYPPQLYQTIFDYNPIRSDTGQVAQELAPHFQKVVGLDPSASMLASAVQLPNVEYRKSDAERMVGVADHSVDLIAVAQAAHWFDLDPFFAECRRVLKPSGTLAIWTYALPLLPDPRADELLNCFHFQTLKDHWESNRYLVTSCYPQIPLLPFPDAKRITLDSQKQMSLEEFMCYVDTWSAMNTWKKKDAAAAEKALLQLQKELVAIWKYLDHPLDVHFKITLLLGKAK